MKSLFVLFCALVAGSASASQVTGTASLTLYTEGAFFSSPEVITGRLLQWDDGKISGGVDGGGIISLENKDGKWKGYAYDGFVELGCEASACQGTVRSGNARVSVARDTGRLQGNLSFTRFKATNTIERIAVSADGSIRLERNRDGVYSGSGWLPTRGFGPLQSFSATLVSDGTLARIEDPALFTIFLVTPFVLN